MLESVVMCLTGPICNCAQQNIAWTPHEDNGGYGVTFFCRTCDGKLVVSRRQFKVRLLFLKNYPEGVAKAGDAEKNAAKKIQEDDASFLRSIGIAPDDPFWSS